MHCLGIFAKYWEPGQVKTRLAATLGGQLASDIYRHFVGTLLNRFRSCANARVLCFTPANRGSTFAELAGADWITQAQAPGDLGTRMQAFFEACFRDGAERVVLIGSDSPTLPREYVESAFLRLREVDVVLGPTEDGGYYLVGAARSVAGIFDDIDWSTPRVWEQTVARLGELQLSYESLPVWYDVDDATDLERLRDELLQLRGDDPGLLELLNVIERAI